MFDNVCTLPLSSELFAQTIHPTEPILSVGLSAGHVHTFRLPAVEGDDGDSEAELGFGKVVTQWRTRRHKGSCRSLAFSTDGEVLYSAGTDTILKAASTSTGQVISKIAIPPRSAASEPDQPTLIHALSPQTLLIATDSSALHLYDLRSSPATFTRNQTPQQTHHPHEDYVSSITPLPPSATSSSGFSKQWATTGATTLAVTDLRKGVLARSEDQEEELLSSVFVSGLPHRAGRGSGEKVIVGDAGGVLTLWEKGQWADQAERIVISRDIGGGETIDAITLLPDGLGLSPGNRIAAGMGDGTIKIINLNSKAIDGQLQHDDIEGVVCLNKDVGGRIISGGGQVIKLWVPRETAREPEEGIRAEKRRRGQEGDEAASEENEAEGNSDSDEQIKERKKRKKRKRNKGRDKSAGKTTFDLGEID
ncbi:MAG: WD domain repeat-containing protein 55 [Peltula sp. TS41687]|nr:MAG: WD domain repeat-containing protein 55 [Peltula sp. TS41687]